MTREQLKRTIKTFLQRTGEVSIDALETITYYTEQFADFLQKKEHSPQGKFAPESSILSNRNEGFMVNGIKRIEKSLNYTGTLIIGGTGTSKTVTAIAPSLLYYADYPISLICHDPSTELWEKTSGAHEANDKRIIVLDWTKKSRSFNYNPLKRCRSKADFVRLAEMLISTSNSETKDPFWEQSAIRLLVLIFQILKRTPEGYNNLYNAYILLQKLSSPTAKKQLNVLIAYFAEFDLKTFEEFESFISQNPKTTSGIIMSAQVALQEFYLNAELASITATDNLPSFSSFRRIPTTLYIGGSTTNVKASSKISSVFFQQYFDAFFEKRPKETDLDVAFICEELPLISIKNFSNIAANIRKYRGMLMGVVQSETQIFEKYGKSADGILANLRCKVFLNADLTSSGRLETELGRYEYETDDKKVKTRNLKSRDELMVLNSTGRALITVSGQRAIETKTRPYYKTCKLLQLSEMPPFQYEAQQTEVEVPTLDLDKWIAVLESQRLEKEEKSNRHE